MKTISTITLSLVLTACGGGDPAPDPAQCKAAIVTAGASAPGAGVPPECVFPAGPDIGVTVDAARAATGKFRVYMIGQREGATQVLQFMDKRPGYVEIASLWFTPAAAPTDLHRTLAGVYLNGPVCDAQAAAIRASGSPATCAPATVYDPATALKDLNL